MRAWIVGIEGGIERRGCFLHVTWKESPQMLLVHRIEEVKE